MILPCNIWELLYFLDVMNIQKRFAILCLSLLAAMGSASAQLGKTSAYEEALRQGISRLWAGDNPKAILDDVAKSWDETTAKVGLDKQKAVYNAWAAKSGAYPK